MSVLFRAGIFLPFLFLSSCSLLMSSPQEEYEVDAGNCRLYVSKGLYAILLGGKMNWSGPCNSAGYSEGPGTWRRYDAAGRLVTISQREMSAGKTIRSAGTYGITPGGQIAGEYGVVNPNALPVWARELVGSSTTTIAGTSRILGSSGGTSQVAASFTPRKRVMVTANKPILIGPPRSIHDGLAGPFAATSWFVMNFGIASAMDRPLRVAVQATGGYRNDYIAGWSASIPNAGARCVAYRSDLLGIEIIRQGLELPTALPGMGETATSRIPTTVYPAPNMSTLTVTFGCDAPISVGQEVYGQFRVLIEENGRWVSDDLLFQRQPLISR